MKNPHQILKVTPLAAAVTMALSAVPVAFADDSADSRGLEEVIVTARKRSESVMEIPASIQALSGDTLKEMGATSVADYARFMPAVTLNDQGAGSYDVVFRGCAVSSGGYVGEASASMYMDEISLTTAGQQPELVYVDVNRVESLEGPQGTLYGSDSQCGTLRVITNQPEMDVTEITIDGGLANGADSAVSYDSSVVVNVPLADNVAGRFVAFKYKDGGFIDNVPGNTIDNDTKAVAVWGYTPSGWGTLDNSEWVAKDINHHEVDGYRASIKWDINDQWSSNLTYLKYNSDSGSYGRMDPNVGDLENIVFGDDTFQTDYDITALTVEGDLGFAQLVSATSYYNSKSKGNQDITNYHKAYAAYYCYEMPFDSYYYVPDYFYETDTGFMITTGNYCNGATVEGDYLAAFQYTEHHERFSQEIRLTGETDTFDWIVGAFYEESSYGWIEHFGYPSANENGSGTAVENYQQSISLAYYEWSTGETFPNASESWYANSDKDIEQTAVFGELTWHISDKLDLTLGGRYFDRDNQTLYYEEHPTTNLDADPDFEDGKTLMRANDKKFVPKVSASYQMDDDSMVYGLYSVGYRPGGVNRQRGEPFFPKFYDMDKMQNYELGYKGSFDDGNGQLVLSMYRMAWEDYHFELTDPSYGACEDGSDSIPGVCGQPWQVSIANAGDATIDGISLQIDWAMTENFTMGFNLQNRDAKTDTEIELGTVVPKGTKLPLSADNSASIYGSYNWAMQNGLNGYARLQWSYEDGGRTSKLEAIPMQNEDGSFNPFPQFVESSNNIGDLSVGIDGGDWWIEMFVRNITDERAVYSQYSVGGYTQQNLSEGRMHVQGQYVNRPREFGMRFSKTFGGN